MTATDLPAPPRRSTHTWREAGHVWTYDRWGTGGRPLLLLHGLLFDRTMWWPVAAELATECLVIAPDLPGHGDTAGRDDLRPAELALELAALVDTLALSRAPVVVGHSTAAVLAATFAATVCSQALVTVDEPSPGPAAAAWHPGGRLPRHDPRVFRAYQSWFTGPALPVPAALTRRAVDGRAAADPVRFAEALRALL